MRTKILALLLAGAMAWSLAGCGTQSTTTSSEAEYESKLFGDDPITINLVVNEDDWQSMLDNARDEQYISANVEINGQAIPNVGVRPKGNSSLSMTKNDRYSMKIKFDKYVDGQTCYGLDKLVLNNEVSDNTYIKNYLCFDMMNWMGVDACRYNYAVVSVNGEYFGLYTALESYDNSFCNRVYGNDDGNLYNVKMSNMSGNGDHDGQMPEGVDPTTMTPPNNGEDASAQNGAQPKAAGQAGGETTGQATDADTGASPQTGGGPGGGMPGGSDTGGSLEYTDDEMSSYSAIFDNAVFQHTGQEEEQRVIAALKALSTGEDLEQYFNVDQILRYLAVQTVVCNFDSYNSNMAQNYYLYEKDGVVSVLPWDYNLAFGGFASGDASACVNWAIDTPVYGAEMENRPLINQLLSNETYRDTYHQYLQQLMDGYLADTGNRIDAITQKIDSYVQTDPTAFCTYEAYQAAVSTLKNFLTLRAESIQGQLNGTIPTTTEGQKADTASLIDSSGIQLSDMGSQGGGDKGPGGQMPDGSKNGERQQDAQGQARSEAQQSERQTEKVQSDTTQTTGT